MLQLLSTTCNKCCIICIQYLTHLPLPLISINHSWSLFLNPSFHLPHHSIQKMLNYHTNRKHFCLRPTFTGKYFLSIHTIHIVSHLTNLTLPTKQHNRISKLLSGILAREFKGQLEPLYQLDYFQLSFFMTCYYILS